MKRYIITSPRYTGEVNVLYGLDNKLLFIDFMKCDLSQEQIEYFKSKLPVIFSDNFLQSFGNNTLSVVEEGYVVSFEDFWNRYNLKRNKNRCIALWSKLSEADQVNAFFKLASYERYLTLNNWRNKKEPDTYLRTRAWESDWSK